MATEETLHVAVYLDSTESREQAEAALEGTTARYGGIVEGEITPERLDDLTDAGFVVQTLDLLLEPENRRGVQADAVDEFKNEADLVSFAGDEQALVTADEPADARDPRLHRYSDTDATPDPEEAPEEDVYYIQLDGPITREERLELYNELGVDIAAFEPDRGYRAFLTKEQYAKVLELDYVTGCLRYDFERVVTPELLETVQEAQGGEGPTLLGDDAEPAGPLVFDCLLHREQDLEQIRELIDNSAGTAILGTSNLRIRFQADANLPFLAALAVLPEVRKLSTYEEPTL